MCDPWMLTIWSLRKTRKLTIDSGLYYLRMFGVNIKVETFMVNLQSVSDFLLIGIIAITMSELSAHWHHCYHYEQTFCPLASLLSL